MDCLQVLVVLLLVVLFMFGLVSVVDALAGFANAPEQIAKRTSLEMEEIASEGERAMDDLSQHYLDEVYDNETSQQRR